MNKCPFCNIEITENKCSKCGFKDEEEYLKDFNSSKEKKYVLKKEESLSNNYTEKKESEIISFKQAEEFLLLGFFKRSFISVLDQVLILFLTYLLFLTTIKSQLDIPYASFEYIAYFIINYESLFITTIIYYLAISLIYYSMFNILFSGTIFSKIFSYKLYKNEKKPSIFLIIIRNFFMILFNFIFLLFPYLFIFVSDHKQSLYDKLFGVYFAKKI